MYLSGKIQVIINGQTLDSVVSVEVHNDGNHIGSTCEITLPLNCRIRNSDSKMIAPTRFLFNTGDHIIINAKYQGYESQGNTGGYQRVFEGFLFDFYESNPVKIKCLDFIYWFNMGIYGANYVFTKAKKGQIKGGTGKFFAEIEFADLLQDLIDWVNDVIANSNDENGTGYPAITLIKPEFTFKLVNIPFTNLSPAAVLEWLKRELGFNISMIGNSLYANVASFTRNHVKLNTQYNVIQSSLQSTNLIKHKTKQSKGANSVFLRIKVKAYFENEDGTKESFEVGDPNGQLREVYFYKVAKGNLVTIGNQTVYENYYKYANEALNKCYQSRYTGEVETYLYPKIDLFDRVTYEDVRYPERNGEYVATMVRTTINEQGYHHHVKLSFITDYNIVQASNG